MTIEELREKIKANFAAVEKYIREDAPVHGGKIAVDHFNESFVNEGFTDKTLKKWDDVKRRDSTSDWYGFSLRSNSQNPNKKAVEVKGTKKDKKAKKPGLTNFSPTRTKDKILTGDSNELQNSIEYIPEDRKFTILSDKPYASVHQFGGTAKIFGKKSFTMKARPFIGRSDVLIKKLHDKLTSDLMKITGVK